MPPKAAQTTKTPGQIFAGSWPLLRLLLQPRCPREKPRRGPQAHIPERGANLAWARSLVPQTARHLNRCGLVRPQPSALLMRKPTFRQMSHGMQLLNLQARLCCSPARDSICCVKQRKASILTILSHIAKQIFYNTCVTVRENGDKAKGTLEPTQHLPCLPLPALLAAADGGIEDGSIQRPILRASAWLELPHILKSKYVMSTSSPGKKQNNNNTKTA